MMNFISVKNWSELQHYKDRSPPWIKLHNALLDDYAFCNLTDASKAHLLAIMMLASRTNNKIPADPDWISRKIGATDKIDLKILIDSGFLQSDQSLTQCEHDASMMLQTAEQNAIERRGEESRAEQSRAEDIDKKKTRKPESFKRFFELYPDNKKGGTDSTAWKKAKSLKLSEHDFESMIIDIEKRKSLCPSWYEKYALGITRYMQEKFWLTPINPDNIILENDNSADHKQHDKTRKEEISQALSDIRDLDW